MFKKMIFIFSFSLTHKMSHKKLTFEKWAKKMHTPGRNKLVNQFGMTMSPADSPKISPDPGCYSPHMTWHSPHSGSTGCPPKKMF
jgi:hypothetical protein